jgi:Fur family transcriptional regulator, ferric uptake regulator
MRDAGHRSGAVRTAVVELLAQAGCLMSVDEVIDALAQDGVGSRASVYRVLDQLVELGLVQRLEDVSHVARFEIVDDHHHHHHLVNETTGEIVAFTDPVLEASIEAIATRLGIILTSHDVILRGRPALEGD